MVKRGLWLLMLLVLLPGLAACDEVPPLTATPVPTDIATDTPAPGNGNLPTPTARAAPSPVASPSSPSQALPSQIEASPPLRRDRADGAERLYLPTAPASAQNPLCAPDGKMLLFNLFHQGYNRGPAGIYRLNLAVGTVTSLLDEAGQDSVHVPGSSWNAVTNRITFSSDRVGGQDIWTAAPDLRALFRVTHHAAPPYFVEPTFSPDGQWIVFEADNQAPEDQQQGSIWKVRVNGSGLTRLTDGPGGGTDDRLPNWAPVGDRILFQRRAPGRDDWNLYTIAPDGTSLRQVTTDPYAHTDSSWSPDGQWIVYSSNYGGLPLPNIFVISASGGAAVRVTHDDTHEDGAPCWSPDALWIAFESHTERDENSRSGLWRIAAPDLGTGAASPTPFTPATPVSTTILATPATPLSIWRPALNTDWQWQLEGLPVDQTVNAAMYDVDLFDNGADVVAALHARGRHVVCYVNVGAWEDWRPDKDLFAAALLGKVYTGYPDEKWLDIRRTDQLAPIMRSRLDLCKAKGFDAVEPDNIDGYTNDTGFPITYQDQLAYNRWLATEAHSRGLSIGLKNDSDQVGDLVAYFDWALTEDCFAQGWCAKMSLFVQAGKAVFAAEYTDTGAITTHFCPQANVLNFNAILKRHGLDAWRQVCR